MNILALEPYYGGSHRAFLTGWQQHSDHDWTTLHLPPYKWKWRMRHAAITFAEQANALTDAAPWDIVWCSDMLNLAEFKGLVAPAVGSLPTVRYFHENQLTYPTRRSDERDHHFAFTNLTSALAADAVWFNTGFHRDSFLDALRAFLRRMPDHQPLDAVERIRNKSTVWPQGIETFPQRPPRRPGPLRILWAARWEYDKNPELFFEAIERLATSGRPFRLSVVGPHFDDVPDVFERARTRFADHVDHWGYLPTREHYRDALLDADVVVSTADHEFFGVAIAEALAAGAFPLLPRRLAYPELVADIAGHEACLYDGSAAMLAERLADLASRDTSSGIWDGDPQCGRSAMQRFTWPELAPRLDEALAAVRQTGRQM